jgi:hypothetical protein
MDPVSVSITCAGLLTAVLRLSLQIGLFVSNVRDAKKDMDLVSRELSSLSLSLNLLRDDSAKIDYPEGAKQSLVEIIGNCVSIIRQMETLLERFSSESLRGSAHWAFTGRDEMNKLRSTLEAYRAAIDVALEMVTM